MSTPAIAAQNLKKQLQELLKQRILIIDGAMGTMIQRHKLEEEDYRGERFADFEHDVKGNNDLLVLTQPHIIQGIHAQYLEAGADIIETNTFNGTQVSMADYHMEHLVSEVNTTAARLARQVCDEFTAKILTNPALSRVSLGQHRAPARSAQMSIILHFVM